VFFKVELSDISDRYCLLGSAGKSDEKISLTDTAYQYPLADGRKIFIVSAEKVPSVWEALRDTVKPVGTELWQLMDIRSGLGHVEVDTVDLFIPQMLNFQAIGAISFKKGCYTGQEVVARMKYLGRLKRRMYRIGVPAPKDRLLPGMPCYLQGQNQSVGHVVSTARCDTERLEMLVVLNEEAAGSDGLVIGIQPYSAIEKLSIPYEIK
jgi:folate-binding protein YgfZ